MTTKLPRKLIVKDYLEIAMVEAVRALPQEARHAFVSNFLTGVQDCLGMILAALRESDPEKN